MKITKEELINMGACKPGLARFRRQTHCTEEAVDVASLVGGLNSYHDLLWLAGETLSKERIVRFACDCALLIVDLIKDHSIHFDEIKKWLIKPVKDDTKSVKMYSVGVYISFNDDEVCSAASAVHGAAATAHYNKHGAYAKAANVACTVSTFESCKARVDELLKQMFNEVE